jgi:hypothetical protein
MAATLHSVFHKHPYLTDAGPALSTREIANNLTAIAEGFLAHPTGGAFACTLTTDCGESALPTDSDENARGSHPEPPRSLAAAALDPWPPTRRRPCFLKCRPGNRELRGVAVAYSSIGVGRREARDRRSRRIRR